MPNRIHYELPHGTEIELNNININVATTEQDGVDRLMILDDWKSGVKVYVPFSQEAYDRFVEDLYQQKSGIEIAKPKLSKVVIPNGKG